MIIDGEKFACEACVRGHRVSNCQHADRPLQHINKKGRPVSQCQHCRSMRKSRSAHVKCDCGEKTSKCAHLQPTLEGHRETCCCNHGGRCSCSHKKEPGLDTVPESDSDKEANAPRPKPPTRRRRANTVHSDGMLTFDENGHHKPAHKHNKASQKCGPYQLNRVNSLHSTGSLGSHSPERVGDNSLKDPISGRAGPFRQQRLVKSEAASPLMRASTSFQQLNNQLPPLDLSSIEYPTYVPNATFDLFSSPGMSSDHDAPIFSAGLSTTSVDWSHIDLGEKMDKFAPSSYSQAGAQSFNGVFDLGTGSEPAPTLAATTSTSGEVSEVEDNFIAGDSDYDGFGTGSSSFIHPTNFLSTGTDLSAIDYDSFVKSSTNKFMTAPSFDESGPNVGSSVAFDDDPAIWGQHFNDGIATYAESHDGLAQFNPDSWTLP